VEEKMMPQDNSHNVLGKLQHSKQTLHQGCIAGFLHPSCKNNTKNRWKVKRRNLNETKIVINGK
jgi:hypothetical protein